MKIKRSLGTVKRWQLNQRSSRDTSVVLGWALVFDETLSHSSRFNSSSSCFAGGFSGTHRSAPRPWWVQEEVSGSQPLGSSAFSQRLCPLRGHLTANNGTVATPRGFESYNSRLRATSTSILLVPKSTGIGSQIIFKTLCVFCILHNKTERLLHAFL